MVEQDRGQHREVSVATLGGDQQPPAANIVQDQLTQYQQDRERNQPPVDRSLTGPRQPGNEALTFNMDIYRLPSQQDRAPGALGQQDEARRPGNTSSPVDLRTGVDLADTALRALGRVSRILPVVGLAMDSWDASSHFRAGRPQEGMQSASRAGFSIVGGLYGAGACALTFTPPVIAGCALAGSMAGGLAHDGAIFVSRASAEPMFADLPGRPGRTAAGR